MSESWISRLNAPPSTRLILDTMDQHTAQMVEESHYDAMDVVEAQYAQSRLLETSFRDLASLSQQTQEGVSRLADNIAELGARFDWGIKQILHSLEQQTKQIEQVAVILRSPLETQARELWERAQYAAQREWFEEAIGFYEQTIEKSPFLYPAHLQLGLMRAYRFADAEAGISSLQLAVRYSLPDDPIIGAQALFHLHKLLEVTGKSEEAWTAVCRACELDPGLGAAWWERSLLAVERGAVDEVIGSLQHCIRQDPLYWHRAQEVRLWGGFIDRVEKLRQDLLHAAGEHFQKEEQSFVAHIHKCKMQLGNVLESDRATLGSTIAKHETMLNGIQMGVDQNSYSQLVTGTLALKLAYRTAHSELADLLANLEWRRGAVREAERFFRTYEDKFTMFIDICKNRLEDIPETDRGNLTQVVTRHKDNLERIRARVDRTTYPVRTTSEIESAYKSARTEITHLLQSLVVTVQQEINRMGLKPTAQDSQTTRLARKIRKAGTRIVSIFAIGSFVFAILVAIAAIIDRSGPIRLTNWYIYQVVKILARIYSGPFLAMRTLDPLYSWFVNLGGNGENWYKYLGSAWFVPVVYSAAVILVVYVLLRAVGVSSQLLRRPRVLLQHSQTRAKKQSYEKQIKAVLTQLGGIPS